MKKVSFGDNPELSLYSATPAGVSSQLIKTIEKRDYTALKNKRLYASFLKRLMDIFIAVVAAPFYIPIIAFLIFGAMIDRHNPFYKQKRIGKNGKTFYIWKIRTMVPDAENVLKDYLTRNPDAQAEWDAKQKLVNDPRITRFGHFARKYSLDELPQIFNILNGTMSLIGPRPMMVEQRELYPCNHYFNMRPGITGLWQVSERNSCDFRDRAYYDRLYWKKLSFVTDVTIIFKTVGVVLRGTGM